MLENFTNDYGWIEIAFFYSIALGFAVGQIWLMNREIKKDKEKAAAKKAEEEARQKADGDVEDTDDNTEG